MTTEKIKSANEVLIDFCNALSDKKELDVGTASAVRGLHSEGKLTKINLLRRLEGVRKEAFNQVQAPLNADDG